jgi:uncharacterized membrane protein
MYLWLKVLHVIAVVMFLGNITTGLFWHAHGAKTRDARILEHTMAGIIRSDRLFTVPAVLLIIASGVATAISGSLPLLRTGWILWTLVLFAVSGIVFMARDPGRSTIPPIGRSPCAGSAGASWRCSRRSRGSCSWC